MACHDICSVCVGGVQLQSLHNKMQNFQFIIFLIEMKYLMHSLLIRKYFQKQNLIHCYPSKNVWFYPKKNFWPCGFSHIHLWNEWSILLPIILLPVDGMLTCSVCVWGGGSDCSHCITKCKVFNSASFSYNWNI